MQVETDFWGSFEEVEIGETFIWAGDHDLTDPCIKIKEWNSDQVGYVDLKSGMLFFPVLPYELKVKVARAEFKCVPG